MSELLDAIGEQLESQDYTVEEKGEEIFEARHPERWNFVFTQDVGGVLLRSSIGTQQTAADLELYDLINDVHSDSAVLRIYLDEDGDLALEAWWPPIFEEEAFEMFVQAWNHDISLIAGHDEAAELLE